MAKDHGPSVKNDKQYEGLRKKGMSKKRAARIANAPDSSSKGGKASGGGKKRGATKQGGTESPEIRRRPQGRQEEQVVAQSQRSPSHG